MMLTILGKLLITWGSLGGQQMCAGFFCEIKVPEELKNTNF